MMGSGSFASTGNCVLVPIIDVQGPSIGPLVILPDAAARVLGLARDIEQRSSVKLAEINAVGLQFWSRGIFLAEAKSGIFDRLQDLTRKEAIFFRRGDPVRGDVDPEPRLIRAVRSR
jgi:hypothetical protein